MTRVRPPSPHRDGKTSRDDSNAPPRHCQHDPIELTWARVAENDTTTFQKKHSVDNRALDS